MKNLIKAYIVVISSLIIISCGGGGGSGNTGTGGGSITPSTGVFIDSPIINIGYRTETLSGVTSLLGEYQYLPGETVIFFIGDLEFPATNAIGIVTPLNIANSINTSDPTVINMIRLLQTLDKDGDASNGLTITSMAVDSATIVDFNLSELDFALSSAVSNLISNGGQDAPVTVLINTSVAIANFENGLESGFSINMVGKTATSIVTTNEMGCSGVVSGFMYTSFTNTTVIRLGADGFDGIGTETGCIPSAAEEEIIVISDLEADFDIPFNCASYPICTNDDFNQVTTQGPGNTSTFSFNVSTNVLTYTTVESSGRTVIEVITIIDEEQNNQFTLDLTTLSETTSVFTFSNCSNNVEGGFAYTFTNTGYTLSGSDTFNNSGPGTSCTLGPDEVFSVTFAEIQTSFPDAPFNCGSDNVCQFNDLNRKLSGMDQDGRDFRSVHTHVPGSNIYTVVKEILSEGGGIFTEVITLQ